MGAMTKEEAVEYFETQTRLAEALDVKQHTVSGWSKVPLHHQFYLQKLTRGKLKADPHPAERGESA